MPTNPNLAKAMQADVEHPRRTAIKQMAGLLGLTLSASSLNALAQSSAASIQRATKFLDPEQLQMTGEIAEMIIPATDTPGALATDVHGFIDHYLVECMTKAEQDTFLTGLKKINLVAEEKFHKTFLACTPKQHVELITELDKGTGDFNSVDQQFFKLFKSLTLFGYYTSEAGATQELAYLAIPGGYKGNFPFAKIGKAWALN